MESSQWDARYEASELVWSAEPNRFLVEEVSGMQPGRALDIAAGEGRNAIWLATGGWSVTAVDFSPVGVGKAIKISRNQGVDIDWVVADLNRYQPAAGAFDLVIVFYLHLPPDERRHVLTTAAAALAPGGTFLYVGHDKSNIEEGYGGPQVAEILPTPDQVALDLAGLEGLEIEKAERVFRSVETPEGQRTAIDALVRARRVDRHMPDKAD